MSQLSDPRAAPFGDRWVALTTNALAVGEIYDWAVLARCGAVVVFSGTVRDHAEGRSGVSQLTYEAYEDQAIARLHAIIDELLVRWPSVGRVAMLHRTGCLELRESSVVVAVSAAHRPEAFEAARFGIDALKASVPIWKHEVWETGSDWGTGAQPAILADAVPSTTFEVHHSIDESSQVVGKGGQ